MVKRTRVFLLAAAGVLVLGLATALVGSAIGVPGLAALGTGVLDDLGYVPDSARMVSYADVRQLMRSPFRARIEQFQRSSPQRADGLEARTGIDVETDVDQVVAASLSDDAGPGSDRTLLIAHGRFDEGRIEGLMQAHGAVVERHRATRLLVIKDDVHDTAIAFPDPGTVLFGDSDSVRRALDTKAGASASVTTNSELMGLVSGVEDGTAWTVARFDALANQTALPPAVASQFPPITWLAASGHVDADVRGFIRAEAADEESARSLREVVRGFVALARIQGRQQPALGGMLDSIELGGEGKTVSLSFAVTPAMLDVLGSAAAGRPAAPRRPRPQGDPQIF